MPYTLKNSNGNILRAWKNNTWNKEGKYTNKPEQAWTFADKNMVDGQPAGKLKEAMDALIAAGNEKLEIVQVEAAPKKEKKPAEKKEEPVQEESIADEPEEEVDEMELFKKGKNPVCEKCGKDCWQPFPTEPLNCEFVKPEKKKGKKKAA